MPRTASSDVASRVAGQAIRDARRDAGVTQAELARRIRSSASYISALEAGKGNITVGQLWAVADALRVEVHIELRKPEAEPPIVPEPPPNPRG